MKLGPRFLLVIMGLLGFPLTGNAAPLEPIPIEWVGTVVTNVSLTQHYNVRTWTTSDGLPMNNIHALLQARNGYLWIATQGGLARFDGSRFTIFNGANTPAFRKDDCLSLAEAPDGTLWIGTAEGIVRFQNKRFEHIPVAHSQPDGRRVNALCVTASGGVWAATGQGPGGIQEGRFVPDAAFTRYAGDLPVHEACAIGEDASGNLFVANRVGLHRRAPEATEWQRFYEHSEWKLFRSADGTVWGVDPLLYQATNGVVVRHDLSDPEFFGSFRAAASDREGRIWTAVENKVYKYDGAFRKVRTSRELPGEINALIVDRDASIWAGTTRGLAYVTGQFFSSITTSNGLVSDQVWSISQAPDGALWFGTDGGVGRFKDAVLECFRAFSRVLENPQRSHAVLALRSGDVWTAPDGVLCRLYPFPPDYPWVRKAEAFENDHSLRIPMDRFGWDNLGM